MRLFNIVKRNFCAALPFPANAEAKGHCSWLIYRVLVYFQNLRAA
jgi:hypothetical protein